MQEMTLLQYKGVSRQRGFVLTLNNIMNLFKMGRMTEWI
ncbi:hypothetical protein SPV1_03728 [Mariprofundus ferrooxydans PV-1]|uniref:Uncharacterized protein n=1 Tax=Mariprofundus ferrooxydans PV-1 TaxID=314345 RepID=Q0F3P5_9PROT|nr:hypothetical protein SPV1_03728 [Mariprofundus ferrooxydans PV-1]